MSLTAGVGSICTLRGSDACPDQAADGLPLPSLALGVGNDEQPSALMASSGVGCSHNSPSCRPPHAGKVSEDSVKAQSEVASDVFQHDESRFHFANGSQDVRPQVSLIVSPFPQAGVGEGLAWVAACQHVNGLNRREVHLGYVAVVGDGRIVVVKNAGGRLVVLDVPSHRAAQHRADGHVQAAVAAEE
jgi:hypothetical protein